MGNNLDEKAVHTVSIKVLPDKLDKGKILFEQNRSDLANNAAKYDGTNWYAGAIFLVGELMK